MYEYLYGSMRSGKASKDSERLCMVGAYLEDALSDTIQDLLARVGYVLGDIQNEIMGNLEALI
jgi:hypothetical protein